MESMSRAPGWSWKVLKQQEPCSQRMWKLSEKWRFVWQINMLPKSKKRKARQHWVCFLRVACYSHNFERRVEEKNPFTFRYCWLYKFKKIFTLLELCTSSISLLFILFSDPFILADTIGIFTTLYFQAANAKKRVSTIPPTHIFPFFRR